jgi:hypothetical protein
MSINDGLHTRTAADTQLSVVVLEPLLITEDYQERYISQDSKIVSDGCYELLMMFILLVVEDHTDEAMHGSS